MTEEDEFSLSIVPLESSKLPPDTRILAAGRALLESTTSWAQGKTYCKGTVKTLRHKDDTGASWHCRLSEHLGEEATFDELWEKLGGKDKALNEKEFIPEIKEAKKVKDVSPTASIWMLRYAFSPPVSPRVFTVLQVFDLPDTTPRVGIVVSIPIDPHSFEEETTFKKNVVQGRYVSVERIKELDDGKIEWVMATSSHPGGLIPRFIAESSVPSKIAQDVPRFLGWLRDLRK